jgi:hypothetical protein
MGIHDTAFLNGYLGPLISSVLSNFQLQKIFFIGRITDPMHPFLMPFFRLSVLDIPHSRLCIKSQFFFQWSDTTSGLMSRTQISQNSALEPKGPIEPRSKNSEQTLIT